MPRFVIHIEKIGRIGLMNNTEFYERLGVDKSASQDEIKKAYRKLSKKYHPDINHEEGAEAKYKEIQEAYETLGDEQKRAMYDQYGAADGQAGGFGGQGGFGGFGGGQYGDFSDLGDIFSQMFGGGFQDPNRPRKGQDLQYRMNLTFEEAVFGKETTISYTRSTENGGQESKELKVTVQLVSRTVNKCACLVKVRPATTVVLTEICSWSSVSHLQRMALSAMVAQFTHVLRLIMPRLFLVVKLRLRQLMV